LPNGETVTLRELFARFEEYIHRMDERDRRYAAERLSDQRAVEAAFKASEKAIDKAEQAQVGVNERGNEFRGQLDDQAKRLMTKDEAGIRFATIEEKVEALRQDVGNLRESRSQIVGGTLQMDKILAYIAAFGGLAVAAAAVVLSK